MKEEALPIWFGPDFNTSMSPLCVTLFIPSRSDVCWSKMKIGSQRIKQARHILLFEPVAVIYTHHQIPKPKNEKGKKGDLIVIFYHNHPHLFDGVTYFLF